MGAQDPVMRIGERGWSEVGDGRRTPISCWMCSRKTDVPATSHHWVGLGGDIFASYDDHNTSELTGLSPFNIIPLLVCGYTVHGRWDTESDVSSPPRQRCPCVSTFTVKVAETLLAPILETSDTTEVNGCSTHLGVFC